MIKFVILVLALVILAMSFVLGPITLSRLRDHGFRDGRSYAAVAALFLAAGALIFYVNVGMPGAIGPALTVEVDSAQTVQSHISKNSQSVDPGAPGLSLQDAADQLERRLANEPNDKAGWALLATTYRQLGQEENAKRAEQHQSGSSVMNPQQSSDDLLNRLARGANASPNDINAQLELARTAMSKREFSIAVDAYEQAIRIESADSKILADAADAYAARNGKMFNSRADELVAKSISLDPTNRKALWLAGTSAFQKKNWDNATRQWKALLELLSKDGAEYKAVQNNLAAVEKMRLLPSPAINTSSSSEPPSEAPSVSSVAGRVEITNELEQEAASSDTLFVFARALNGPRMPLAIVRKTVADLPLSFSLDDSMAMAPNAKLSMYSELVIGARISKSGNAIAQTGDFEGYSEPVSIGSNNISVVINSVVGN